MIYGSVCSGIEAATVAWHPLGWRPAWFSEIEAFPSAVLGHHYDYVPNLGDMTKFKEWPDADIDVLVGGTPCQSFSVAGLRKGLDDPRGNLTLVYLAIAARFRPRWLVWENVPGILSDKTGAFGAFLGGLAELGYGFAYRILDAQYFGIPQRRRRVFVVGHLGDWRPAAAVLFERHCLQGHPAPGRKKGQGVAGTIDASLGRSRGAVQSVSALTATGVGTCGADDNQGQAGHLKAHSLAIRGRDGVPQIEMGDEVANALLTPNGERGGIGVGAVICMETGQASAGIGIGTTLNCNHEAPIVATAIRTANTKANGHGIAEGVAHTLGQANGQCIAFSCKDHGADAGETAPTLRSMGHDASHANAGGQVAVAFAQNTRDEVRELGGNIAGALPAQPGMKQQTYLRTGTAVRRLTPRECERLQGFPDDYTLIPFGARKKLEADIMLYLHLTQPELIMEEVRKLASDGPRYKALGNSMAVPVMRWIGERIAAVEKLTTEK